MINNFIGIIGSNGREVINVMEEILIKTNAKTDQENIQMNVLITDKIEEGLLYLKKIGSKEIMILDDYQGNCHGINILSKKDISYIVSKYRND